MDRDNITINELPTIATNKISLADSMLIQKPDNQVGSIEYYQITLYQLQIAIYKVLKSEDLIVFFETDPALTNLIYTLQEDLNNIIINYDETNLNSLIDLVENTIIPQLTQVVAVLTNNDGVLVDVVRELEFLKDQVDFILNKKNNFKSVIYSVPERIDPAIQYYKLNNYKDTNDTYNFFLDKFQNLIYLNIFVKDAIELGKQVSINFFNVKSIFDDLDSDAILQVKLLFWTNNDLSFIPRQFLSKREIKFYADSIVTTLPLFQFLLFDNIKPHYIPVSQFSFSCWFNKEGFVKHDCPEENNFASQQDLEDIRNILAEELLANFSQGTEIEGDTIIIYFQQAKIDNYFTINNVPPNINKILIFIVQQETLIPVENFYFHFPFHELKTDTIEVVVELAGKEQKGQTIIQNSKQPQWMQASYAEQTNVLKVFSLLQELLPIKTIDLLIKFGKENTPKDFIAVVDQHCEQLNINIKLEQPFLQQNEFLPQFFNPAVLPNQSENLIAFQIDSLVGKLDSLQFIEVVLNLGDCDGFFRNFAFFFSGEAVPTNFDYNASQLYNQIVPVGINNKIDGVTTTLATRSFYRFQIKKENDICFATLLEVNSANDISLEKNRLIQWQELFQAYSTQMFDMLVYFPQSFISNRASVNFDNLAFNTLEYTISNVSVLIPPRETEYKFVGALLINPKNDRYQNNKLAVNSNSLVIIQKFHIVDWNCDSEAFVEKTDDERTIFIVLEDFITSKTLYFNLDITFGSRFGNVGDSQKFYIKIINNKQNIIINDQNPSFNKTYGLQLDNPNILYTKEFEIVRRPGKPPLAQQLDKTTLQFAFATSPTINAEIPYNAPLIKSIDPEKYWTITEVENYVQQEIVNISTGGEIDLSGYATKLYVSDEINALSQTFINTFATKTDLSDYVKSTTLSGIITQINDKIENIKTDITTIKTNITTINNDIEKIQPHTSVPLSIDDGNSSAGIYMKKSSVRQIIFSSPIVNSKRIYAFYNSTNPNQDQILSAEIFVTCVADITSFNLQFSDDDTLVAEKTFIINGKPNARKYLVRIVYNYNESDDNKKYFAEAIATDFDLTTLTTLTTINDAAIDAINQNLIQNYYTSAQVEELVHPVIQTPSTSINTFDISIDAFTGLAVLGSETTPIDNNIPDGEPIQINISVLANITGYSNTTTSTQEYYNYFTEKITADDPYDPIYSASSSPTSKYNINYNSPDLAINGGSERIYFLEGYTSSEVTNVLSGVLPYMIIAKRNVNADKNNMISNINCSLFVHLKQRRTIFYKVLNPFAPIVSLKVFCEWKIPKKVFSILQLRFYKNYLCKDDMLKISSREIFASPTTPDDINVVSARDFVVFLNKINNASYNIGQPPKTPQQNDKTLNNDTITGSGVNFKETSASLPTNKSLKSAGLIIRKVFDYNVQVASDSTENVQSDIFATMANGINGMIFTQGTCLRNDDATTRVDIGYYHPTYMLSSRHGGGDNGTMRYGALLDIGLGTLNEYKVKASPMFRGTAEVDSTSIIIGNFNGVPAFSRHGSGKAGANMVGGYQFLNPEIETNEYFIIIDKNTSIASRWSYITSGFNPTGIADFPTKTNYCWEVGQYYYLLFDNVQKYTFIFKPEACKNVSTPTGTATLFATKLALWRNCLYAWENNGSTTLSAVAIANDIVYRTWQNANRTLAISYTSDKKVSITDIIPSFIP